MTGRPLLEFWVAVACIWGIGNFTANLAQAQMSSNSFLIQFGNFNITSGKDTSASYNVTNTVGQTGNGQYTSADYLVRAGFQYIYTIGTFSFHISNTNIDFGELTPSTFATASTTLTISAKGAGGYQVTAAENQPLLLISSTETIPDTTCDAGSCSETTAGTWTLTNKYGFGYNMTGSDIPAAFSSNSIYKQFADQALGEAPQVVMSNTAVVTNQQATVNYKINISTGQAAGQYTNYITYTAIPSY